MMRPMILTILMMTGSLAVPLPSGAATIVDTGPGPTDSFAASLDPFQWLAAEFTTSDTWLVTDVQGWIRPFGAGDVAFVLYSDGGDIPGTEIFSQSLTIDPSGQAGWIGPAGLTWSIAPGTYWLAFEVRDGSSFLGAIDVPSTNPLGNEAFKSGRPLEWNDQDDLSLGLRIFG